MAKKYTEEQYWQLFQKLPEELQEAVFSMETADAIYNACVKNGVKKTTDVAGCVGDVLMGILPPSDFKETIEKEIGLPEKAAKAIAQEINRFVFYPVKPLLEDLYKIEIGEPEGAEKPASAKATAGKEEKPEGPPRKDTYREAIE